MRTARQDLRQGLVESFTHDALNRLSSVSGPGGQSLTIQYFLNGNIQSRTDLGSYTYHATKKHAVTAAGSNSYSYDANGNMITRNGSSLAWTSYNLPATLNAGSYSAQFAYGPDRARWRQISSYANGTETTIYVGGLLEKLTTSARTHWKHLIATPSGPVQVIRRSDGTSEVLYVATDHLGSTDAVVNAAASVASRESFSVFGARRSSTWQGAPSAGEWQAIIDTSRRGFTGHEHVDNVALIHMNGRVYDPALGRFTSADPLIDGPHNSQGWNRYAYVHNRPLSATDPSGYATDTDLQPENVIVHGQRLTGVSWTGQFINWLGVDMLDVVVLDAQGFLRSLGGVAPPIEGEVLVEATRIRDTKAAGGGGAPTSGQSRGQKQSTNCPAVPAAPPGVNVNDNIDIAKDYSWLNPGADAALIVNVQNFGPWDYKRQGRQYEEFGNFNFGAVTAAMGMPYYVAQNGAGIYQQWEGAAAAGSGTPIIKWPYGDANSDAKQIQLGQRYVQQGCHKGAK